MKKLILTTIAAATMATTTAQASDYGREKFLEDLTWALGLAARVELIVPDEQAQLIYSAETDGVIVTIAPLVILGEPIPDTMPSDTLCHEIRGDMVCVDVPKNVIVTMNFPPGNSAFKIPLTYIEYGSDPSLSTIVAVESQYSHL